ncbi:hypothetical protein SAMN03003324_01983 [Pedobacter antarcticus]|nr:SPOR domain-containing protein [Pedobacter antarcticus]SFE95878.1 hypothetical protein SAMN03003324_01983 [Pedobacter antarcticus]
MDILSYLSELLQTRKSVGISGLGTVYKKKVPGRYDADTHSFLPPGFVLDFTTDIQEESALPEYICQEKHVTADTAAYVIEEFSKEINQQLEAGKEVDFGSLGKLLIIDQKIRLVPADSAIEGSEYYGLPPVEESPEVNIPVTDQSEEIENDGQDNPATEIFPETPAADDAIGTPVNDEVDDTEIQQDEVDPASLISTPVPPMENPVVLETTSTAGTAIPLDSASAKTENDQQIFKKSINDQFKTEEQLRSEIEALNYYRSKSPVSKPIIKEDDELLWKLKKKEEITPDPVIEQEPVVPFYQSEDEEVRGTPAYLKIIYALLILGIIAGAAYVIQPSLFNVITGNKPGMPHPSQQTGPVSSPAAPLTDSSVKDSINKDKPAIIVDSVSKISKPVAALDTATLYEIIGASMHDKKEADAFIALMKKSGIEAKVVTNMAGRRLKMSIGTFKDEETAKQELEKLSHRLKIPGIYIYKNKQK